MKSCETCQSRAASKFFHSGVDGPLAVCETCWENLRENDRLLEKIIEARDRRTDEKNAGQ